MKVDNPVPNNEIEINETMEKFGKYQMLQYFYTCLATIIVTMTHVNFIFVAGDLNYRCRVPECDDQYPVYDATWWSNSSIDRCTRPSISKDVGQTCTNTSISGVLGACTEWVYEGNYTVIAELNLACQPWKANSFGTIHSIGMVFGSIVSGWIADRFGRKPALIICTVGSCIGHLKAFTTSYYIFLLIEFIEAVISGGTYTAVMVLMIEISGKRTRLLSGVLYAYAIYMGESIFACIAMFVPYWKDLIDIVYSPPFICLSYIYLLKESPRWQIVNGKSEEAKEILLQISRTNNVNINKDKLANLSEETLKKEFKIENCEQNDTYGDAFKSKEILKRLLIGAFSRFSAGFIYNGMMVNSVYLPGNKYTSFMLATVMSYPGEILAMYSMNKFGRRIPLIIGYLICGLFCVASAFIPEDYTWLKTTFFLLGKLVVSGCFTGMILYTMELFPTSVRGKLLGICSLTSSAGNILAPLTPILNTVSIILPPTFFGALALISGALLTQTPETKDLPLMDTIEQVEDNIKLKTTRKRGKNIKGQENHGFEDNCVA